MKKAGRFLLLLLIPLILATQALPLVIAIGTLTETGNLPAYVAFSREEHPARRELLQEASDYEGYESRFRAYGSTYYFDCLSPEEQTVYRILEYALDESYDRIFLDGRLLEGTERSLDEILEFFSLDSPFVEQNIVLSERDTRVTVGGIFGVFGQEVKGVVLRIGRFSEEYLSKKLEALAQARKVVETLSPGGTQLERARAAYRYLTQNASYTAFEVEEDPHYLYSALVEGATQCDGFTNAFSLLCNLMGIPCFEKIHHPREGETVGHTWNCFSAEGTWYNADASASDSVAEAEKEWGFETRFAFSDRMLTQSQDHDDLMPPCQTDEIPLMGSVDPQNSADLRKLAQLVQGRRITLVKILASEFPTDSMQKLADFSQRDLSFLGFEWDGTIYYFILRA